MEPWTPDLADKSGPRYRAIADAILHDIEAGRLEAGSRLPTHRDLARNLGVTVGTVSRAYAEAERRGLVTGEVGRGTFVRGRESAAATVLGADAGRSNLADLSQSVPAAAATEDERQWFADAFRSLARAADLPTVAGFPPPAGTRRHREAGARCLALLGMEVPGSRVLVTAGAQHAMTVTLADLARPGDVVLTGEVTYPGMKGLANLLSLRLRGLAMDADGILPEALARACKEEPVRALYVIPTLQNPTSAVIPPARRKEIAAIAQQHGVAILEDDVYGFLDPDHPAPIASLAPEISYFFTSTAKVIAPGLRVGYLAAPESKVDRLAAGIWATTGMASPFLAEVVAAWIENGQMQRFIEARRQMARQRNDLARRILPSAGLRSHPYGFHVWLQLPEPWRSEDFLVHARRRGVAVTSAQAFAVGRHDPAHAVRISLTPVPELDRLERALRVLADILEQSPGPGDVVV